MGADKPGVKKISEPAKPGPSLFIVAIVALVAIALFARLELGKNGTSSQLGAKEEAKLQKRLKEIEYGIARRQKYAQARYFLDRWFYAFNNRQVTKTAIFQREMQTKHSVFQALYENKLQRLEEKYQVVRVINFFEERRPELLLVFSKVFL